MDSRGYPSGSASASGAAPYDRAPPPPRPNYDDRRNDSYDRRPAYEDRPPMFDDRRSYDRPPMDDRRPPAVGGYDRSAPSYEERRGGYPAYDRAPVYDRQPYDRPPYDRPPYDRPAYDRPPYDRPAYDRYDRPRSPPRYRGRSRSPPRYGRNDDHGRRRPQRKAIVERGTSEERARSTCLFVGNLPYSYTEKDVEAMFERFGKLRTVNLPMDRFTGRNKGYTFVTFEQRLDAEDALFKYHGFNLEGRVLRCDWDIGPNNKEHLKPGASRNPEDYSGDQRFGEPASGDMAGAKSADPISPRSRSRSRSPIA